MAGLTSFYNLTYALCNSFRQAVVFFCFVLMNLNSAEMLAQQKSDCLNHLDSASVMSMAHERKWISANSDAELAPSLKPQLIFDSDHCMWIMITKSYSTTLRGKCRHTNGCTIETTYVRRIAADSGKVISKKSKRKVIPNYEM